MAQTEGRCQGRFLGLVIGSKNKRNDLYSSIQSGECKIVEYIENSNRPELVAFEEEVAKAFVAGMKCNRIIPPIGEKQD